MEEQICKTCGAKLKWKDGGKRKDGTTYKGFMACPEWKSHPKEEKTTTSKEPSQFEVDVLKKLDQIIYLISGITDTKSDEFKQLLTEIFGRGLFKK